MKHRFFISYPTKALNSPDTIMLVTAETNESVTDSNGLMHRLRDGVTEWAKKTEEGKNIYIYAEDDMNIGDIAGCLDEIIPFCKGIISMSFESVDASAHWVFDSQLCESLEAE